MRILGFLGRWASFALPGAILILSLRADFLYRPGFWDLWWLLESFCRALGLAALLALPFGLVPILGSRRFSGAVGAFYLAPALALLGAWPLLALVPLMVAGFSFPPKGARSLTLVHLLGPGFGLFVLGHGKMMLEIFL